MISVQKNSLEDLFERSLEKAGIAINGKNPWDIQIHNQGFFSRVLSEGTKGLGEAYMDGWWDCDELDEFVNRALRTELKDMAPKLQFALQWLKATIFNLQTKRRAYIVGKKHYDLGNDLFQAMLDKRMTYSCAYWKDAQNLDQAQEAKLDLICRKIHLQPGMKVLDIGCGWGSFAKYAAEKYGAQVVGITISERQLELGRNLCKGLPIDLRLQDYRDLKEKFDRIVSVGQMEHVGYKNYDTYMKIVRRSLNHDGLFLLHTIGSNLSVQSGDEWMEKYIFPNGQLPSIKQLAKASEGRFVMEDWHNFGAYYDKTLLAWYSNFDRNWDRLKENYNERFYRMWRFYLLGCAGMFRARKGQLWQIVFSPDGIQGGYNRVT